MPELLDEEIVAYGVKTTLRAIDENAHLISHHSEDQLARGMAAAIMYLVDRIQETEGALRALHYEDTESGPLGLCHHCLHNWPCPTFRQIKEGNS